MRELGQARHVRFEAPAPLTGASGENAVTPVSGLLAQALRTTAVRTAAVRSAAEARQVASGARNSRGHGRATHCV